jgi:hypothetical protein
MGIDERINAANERKAQMEARKAFLEELIVNAGLHVTLLGIARRVITGGEDSLSLNQRSVYEHHVLRPFDKPCHGCGRDIPWDEKYEAIHHDGLCSKCHDRMPEVGRMGRLVESKTTPPDC